jgi:hypothetical protein
MMDWFIQAWFIEAIATILLAILLVWILSKVFDFLDKG